MNVMKSLPLRNHSILLNIHLIIFLFFIAAMHKWPSDKHSDSLQSHRSLVHTHRSITRKPQRNSRWTFFALSVYFLIQICSLTAPTRRRLSSRSLASPHRFILPCTCSSAQQVLTHLSLCRLFSNQRLNAAPAVLTCRHGKHMTWQENTCKGQGHWRLHLITSWGTQETHRRTQR